MSVSPRTAVIGVVTRCARANLCATICHRTFPHRLQASAEGMTRLKQHLDLLPGTPCPAASAEARVAGAGSRRNARTCPVPVSRTMAIGLSVSPSSVAEPPGPESVMLAKWSAPYGSTGRAKAKETLLSPSATSCMEKLKAKSSSPRAVHPAMRYSPAESGCPAVADPPYCLRKAATHTAALQSFGVSLHWRKRRQVITRFHRTAPSAPRR